MQSNKSDWLFLLAADALLVIHVLLAVFIVSGLVFIVLGKLLHWTWVRNPWLRVIHLTAIAIVAAQSWLGVICPLTVWEMSLREYAGDAAYAGTFVAYWLKTLLYYQAPAWVFITGYTIFAALVAGSWFWVRPYPFRLCGPSTGSGY